MRDNDTIQVLELRRLLFELKDLRPDINIRFRLLGEMWQNNFSAVIRLTERGAIFTDEKSGKPFLIDDLNSVIQFEIDTRFQHYEPNFHYSVKPYEMAMAPATA